MPLNFSYCLIAKNEEKTLPKLLKSLEPFKARGGVVCITDTGSTDKTVEIAREWGCIVEEVGDKFLHPIFEDLARQINERFLEEGEEPIVKEGDKYFHFGNARNSAAALSPTDWCFWADSDEEVTVQDIDKIEELIKDPNIYHFSYDFVFSHKPDGSPAVEFKQSKAHRKSKLQWLGAVHEYLSNV